MRQLVEVEYLTWAFAEDEDEAMRWMRSTKEERMRFWQPRHIRARQRLAALLRDPSGAVNAGTGPTDCPFFSTVSLKSAAERLSGVRIEVSVKEVKEA